MPVAVMPFSSFLAWLKRKLKPLPVSVAVHIYTRASCHLCEKAHAQIMTFEHRYPLVVQQTDVDTDPELVARFGNCVPVVVVNGRVRFRGVVNNVLLERLLRAESHAR
jgi:Glutaredoxin-like domain (DUF836)